MTTGFKQVFSAIFIALALGLSACATSGEGTDNAADEPRFSAGEDAKLENRIQRMIREDSAFIGDRIEIEVEQRVVTVTGTVSNRLDASRLERMIREIEEVRGINMGVVESGGRF